MACTKAYDVYLELGGLLGVERGDALAACSGLEAAGAAVLAERDGLTEHLPPHGREIEGRSG